VIAGVGVSGGTTEQDIAIVEAAMRMSGLEPRATDLPRVPGCTRGRTTELEER